jgi:hypothetical protein
MLSVHEVPGSNPAARPAEAFLLPQLAEPSLADFGSERHGGVYASGDRIVGELLGFIPFYTACSDFAQTKETR